MSPSGDPDERPENETEHRGYVPDSGMPRPTPSQAEGDRETIEQDLEQKEGGLDQGGQERYAASSPHDPDDVTFTPSQAEGDRETIERDLDEKGL